MSKLNQKIVLFIEPSEFVWSTPSKIRNLFMNRFAIDEAATHEILKIYQIENASDFLSDKLTLEEGLDLIDYGIIS